LTEQRKLEYGGHGHSFGGRNALDLNASSKAAEPATGRQIERPSQAAAVSRGWISASLLCSFPSASSNSKRDCRFIHICALVPKKRARRRAVSAEIPRFP